MSTSRFTSSPQSLLLVIVAAFFALSAGANVAFADDAACEVFEIKATNGDSGVAKDLKMLEKKLKVPPFSAWKSFDLIKKQNITATQMKPVTLGLSIGDKLNLLYKDRNDAKGKKPRLRVVISMDDAKGKRRFGSTLKFDSGNFSLVGGLDPAKDGAARVLAVRCSVK